MRLTGRPWLAAACFIVGALLVLLVDAGAARIVGVPLIFIGILLGAAVIASPEFLEHDADHLR